MPLEKLAKALGYAGLIPFVTFSVLSWLNITLVEHAHYYLITYAAIILSFMGAVHWGVAMSVESAQVEVQLGVSVIPPLLGWLALLMPGIYGYSLLILSFILLLLFDRALSATGVLPAWYYPLRIILTTVVVLCLLIATLALVVR